MKHTLSQLQKLALTLMHTLLLTVNAIYNMHGNLFCVEYYGLLSVIIDYSWLFDHWVTHS
jgi:hypothetical protein